MEARKLPSASIWPPGQVHAGRFRDRANAIARLLTRIGADKIQAGGVEADIEPLMNAGVPTLGLRP